MERYFTFTQRESNTYNELLHSRIGEEEIDRFTNTLEAFRQNMLTQPDSGASPNEVDTSSTQQPLNLASKMIVSEESTVESVPSNQTLQSNKNKKRKRRQNYQQRIRKGKKYKDRNTTQDSESETEP